MKRLRIFLFIVFAGSIFSAAGVPNIPVKQLKFDALTINEGLSQGMVTAMLQDKYGFMWFGTKDGLNRYDGYHFIVYRNDVRDSTSLSANYIQSIFEDSKGRLWIGTIKGLNLFNRETETFTRFTHSDKDASTISNDVIHGVSEDRNGNILVAEQNYIDRITVKEDEPKTFSIMRCNQRLQQSEFTLAEVKNGNHYLVDKLMGVYRIALDNFPDIKTEHIAASLDFPALPDNVKTGGVQLFIVDSVSHDIYFVLQEYLIRVKETGEAKIICNNCFTATGGAIMDTAGIMLISADYRLVRLDTRTGNCNAVTPRDPNQLNGIRCNTFVYRDRSGTVWVATNGYGLLKLNNYSEKFHHTGSNSIVSITRLENGMAAVHSVGDQRLLFNRGGGIEFDTVSTANAKKYARGFTEYSYPTFYGKERVWFADDDSLYCHERKSGKMTGWKIPVIRSSNVYGLSQAIYDDEKENVWLASQEGLLRFKWKEETWKQFKHVSGDTTSLSETMLLSLCPDPQKPEEYLWLGTNGGGLSRMNIKTEKFTAYTSKDGLPNDVVYGVLSDDDNNLWLSTNKGLSCFNTVKKTFRNYEEKDGLQSNEFNHNAYCKTRDGWMVFGGVGGLNYFNPKEIHDNRFIPQIVITDLKIVNKSVSFRDKDSPVSKPVYLSNEITLPYSDNVISFEFASMDLTAPAKNIFRYKMDGFDKNWIQSGETHAATYTNLDPGKYTFYVKGSNADGVWNETATSFIVTILPPWYMTWWFRFVAVGATIGIAYSFYRYRLQHALKLQEVRNHIAQDLHDEIGSNLSTISIFTDMAISKSGNKTEQVTPLLNKISDYTQNSMEAMSDIVWMINSRNDRFENIIVHMRSHAVEVLEAKNYSLHLNFDEQLNSAKLGMVERKNFYLIYKEALNNIVKYAECKNVWIDMEMKNYAVCLNIKDDGKGFNALNLRRGNGLINMQKRAEVLKGDFEIQSSPGEGTTITLQFSL